MAKKNEERPNAVDVRPLDEEHAEEDSSNRPTWSEVFRQAFDRARREQRANRCELGRDRSRSLFLLAATAIAVLLLVLGVFSSSNTKYGKKARVPGTPDLGRRVTPGQERTGPPGSMTPLLSAQSGQLGGGMDEDVTPEEVDRTARPSQLVRSQRSVDAANSNSRGPYALGRINFSYAVPPREEAPLTSSVKTTSDDLRKASLVFVRDVRTNAGTSTTLASTLAENPVAVDLPTGTRLVARLQSVVSSAVKAPVVAAIEYNYEKDNQIVIPAGAQVLGSLQQADRSGFVAIRFNRVQMPDGSIERIDARAMSLSFGPLKGVVSGKRTGANFLVRAFTGIGQAASYAMGSNGINAPLSQGALLRDQIATNIGIAGNEQLNSLTFNQDVVISVPANTRFYVVIEKGTNAPEEVRPATTGPTIDTRLPTGEELGQLMQLRQELSALGQQPNEQNSTQDLPRE
jgi:hypothetical protein